MSLSSKFITALTVIVLVIILIGIYATYSVFMKTFMEIEVVLGIFFQTIIAVLSLAVCACLPLGLWFTIEEIKGRKQKRFRFAPSEQGYYEAYLTGNTFIKPADNIPLGVPHIYSPKITISGEKGTNMPLSQNTSLPAPSVTLEEVLEELQPNILEFIYGMDRETGELVKTTLPKSIHIQLLGSSRMGKSHEATSIMTQLFLKNDPSRLQLAAIDCEGETSAPFHNLPHVKYLALTHKDAGSVLRELVKEIERRDITKQIFPYIFVFVEEFLNLRRTMPIELREQALDDFTTLAVRGAKRGIALMALGQGAYSEKSIRDAQNQFLSSLAFAIKPSAARAAGFQNNELLKVVYAERQPGVFLLEHSLGDAILSAPYVDYGKITQLLDREGNHYVDTELVSTTESSRKPDGKPKEKLNESALQAVCQLLSQGVTTKGDILFAVWNVKPGRRNEKYEAAENEYKEIMAYLAGLHHE